MWMEVSMPWLPAWGVVLLGEIRMLVGIGDVLAGSRRR